MPGKPEPSGSFGLWQIIHDGSAEFPPYSLKDLKVTAHPWMPQGMGIVYTQGHQLGDTWTDVGYTEGGIAYEKKPVPYLPPVDWEATAAVTTEFEVDADAFAASAEYIANMMKSSFAVPWSAPQHGILADILHAKELVEQAKENWQPLIMPLGLMSIQETLPFMCGTHEGQVLLRDEARCLWECPVYGCLVKLTDENRKRLGIEEGTVIFPLG